MAKVTYKGASSDDDAPVVWRGISFPVGKAVEIDDPWIIAKAKSNPFFDVKGGDDVGKVKPPPEPEHDPHRPHHEPVDVEDDDDHPHRPKARRAR